MSAPTPPPPPPADAPIAPDRRSTAFWPVFAWLSIQALALLAAALRVPFSARFPAPAEQLAVHEMLVAQMIASALLFPLLFRTPTTGVLVVAASPVMLQLSAVLAAEADTEKLVGACVYAGLWLIGLGLWASALRTEKSRLYAVAAAVTLTVGGAVVAYLGREFGSPIPQTFDWASHGYLGPLVGGLAILEAGERTGTVWYFLGAFLISGLIAAGSRWAGWHRASPGR